MVTFIEHLKCEMDKKLQPILSSDLNIMKKSYDDFDNWMQRLAKRLEHIEELCTPTAEQNLSVLPDGDRLLDNCDLCKMLNISKRTLQRYRTSGDLPYQMIYHKTFYRESDVLRFIERNFSNFRKLKKERENNSFGKR